MLLFVVIVCCCRIWFIGNVSFRGWWLKLLLLLLLLVRAFVVVKANGCWEEVGEWADWTPGDKSDLELLLLLLVVETDIVGHATRWWDVDIECSLFVDASWPTLLIDELEPALGVDEPVAVLSPSVRWDLSRASRRPEWIFHQIKFHTKRMKRLTSF